MKKYLLKRIIFSIFSLVVVIGIVNILIYNLMDREAIFQNDNNISKFKYNQLATYKLRRQEEYGYIRYMTYADSDAYKEASRQETKAAKSFLNSSADLTLDDLKQNELLNNILTEYESRGYSVTFLPAIIQKKGVVSNAELVFTQEVNVFERLGGFFGNLIRFETVWDVNDDELTDRYVRIEWDDRSNMPTLVGNGTNHKYLVYFDEVFPFIHQNILHINLGTSMKLIPNNDVVAYMKQRINDPYSYEQVVPKDLGKPDAETFVTSADFHTATYRYGPISQADLVFYDAEEHYTNTISPNSGATRIGISFILGILAMIIAYIIGLPVGIWMAQRKDKLVDKIGNLYIIFIMAVPSLAYIFMLASIGSNLFNLPYKVAFAPNSVAAYILPIISLALPSIGGLMKWMRRYMVDQKNSDYVKFARSQGLSEREIFSKHIARNAFIFLVHSIPADILGCLVGAIVTERVYGVAGIGNMLTRSISMVDNPAIIGVTAFYTALSIIALILGDVLLAKYDPRISLTNERS